jgi:4-amino-4-deoxy-L-arabinose transferase-like glycosyltransferase
MRQVIGQLRVDWPLRAAAGTVREPWILLAGAALLVGTAARAWMLATQAPVFHAVDALFDTLGWNLATDKGFTLDGATPSAHVGPTYPALLALFYSLVGHRPEWTPVLHAVLDVATAVFVFCASRLVFGPAPAALAAGLVYLFPAYWTYDLRLRSESVLTCIVAAWVWASVREHLTGRVRHAALCGLLGGLAILCKPTTIPIAVLLGCLMLREARHDSLVWRRVAVYAACVLVLVTPWTLRNLLAFGTPVPVSSGVGVGLWIGSDADSGGSWPMSPELEARIWETAGIAPLAYPHVMYEVAVDRELGRKGWERIKADPGQYMRLTLARVMHFWVGNRLYLFNSDRGPADGLKRDAAERGWFVALYSLAKRLLLVPLLLLLACVSAWRLRARRRELMPLYVFPLGLMLAYVPFSVEAGRYVLPVLPCVVMLAAGVLQHVGTRLYPVRA